MTGKKSEGQLVQGKMAAGRMSKRRILERRTEIKRWKDERSRNKWWRAYSVRKNNTGINDGVTDCEQTNGGEAYGGTEDQKLQEHKVADN